MSDRPKECCGCHKKACIRYRTIVDGKCVEMAACEKCPAVQSRLQGDNTPRVSASSEEGAKRTCSGCGTHLSDIQSGSPLGCSECYTTFSDYIKAYLTSTDRLKKGEKGVIRTLEGASLHVGKTPFETEDAGLTSRLCDLNDALNEALKIENYEQAAWLRDRIKTLTEQTSEEGQQAS